MDAVHGREFFFLGNELILDFLNTRPVMEGREVELIPDASALLRWFHEARLLSERDRVRLERKLGSSSAQRYLQNIKSSREKLRREVLDWEQGDAVHASFISELNELLVKYPMLTKLNGGSLQSEPYFRASQPEDLFAPLAYSAVTLFATVDRKRVRKCDNCVLHFRDTSKKGKRRWCSMQICGNRAKVAATLPRPASGGLASPHVNPSNDPDRHCLASASPVV